MYTTYVASVVFRDVVQLVAERFDDLVPQPLHVTEGVAKAAHVPLVASVVAHFLCREGRPSNIATAGVFCHVHTPLRADDGLLALPTLAIGRRP